MYPQREGLYLLFGYKYECPLTVLLILKVAPIGSSVGGIMKNKHNALRRN